MIWKTIHSLRVNFCDDGLEIVCFLGFRLLILQVYFLAAIVLVSDSATKKHNFWIATHYSKIIKTSLFSFEVFGLSSGNNR